MEPPAAAYRVFPSGKEASDVIFPLLSGIFRTMRLLAISAMAMVWCGTGPITKAISRLPATVIGPDVSSAAEVSGIGTFPVSTSIKRVCPPVLAVTTARPSGEHRIVAVVHLGWKNSQYARLGRRSAERRTSSSGRSVRLRYMLPSAAESKYHT